MDCNLRAPPPLNMLLNTYVACSWAKSSNTKPTDSKYCISQSIVGNRMVVMVVLPGDGMADWELWWLLPTNIIESFRLHITNPGEDQHSNF